MVGDIKQSIYRFRNANPYIFKNKYDTYRDTDAGCKIDLLKNFRSRSETLFNINEMFNLIMDNEMMINMLTSMLNKMGDEELESSLLRIKGVLSPKDYEKVLEKLSDEITLLGNERYELFVLELEKEFEKEKDEAEGELDDAKEKLDAAAEDISEGLAALEQGWSDYEQGKIDAETQIANSEQQIADTRKKLKESEEELKEEIQKTTDLIVKYIGVEPNYFRPPYISHNQTMHETIDLTFISGAGIEDWVPSIDAQERAKRILDLAKDGLIYLLHDMPGNEATVEALDIAIPQLKEQGYQFVTVPELFKAKNITPEKGTIYTYLLKE